MNLKMNYKKPFSDIFEDVSAGNVKTKQGDYLKSGRYPIIDQGQNLIGGYSNDEVVLCRVEVPAIIFGDHTRIVKYVDFPFGMGADGVKVLRPKIEAHVKYLFYYLQGLNIPNTGYNRHFKYLKRSEIYFPPSPEQRRIAAILDAADALRARRRAALGKLDALLRAVFLEMFGDPMRNPKGWEVHALENICERIVDCPHSTPHWTDDGIVCIRTSNLTVGGWNWEDTRYVSHDEYTERVKRSEIVQGDIILSREGTVGIAAVVEPGMQICMGQRLVQLRPDMSKAKSEFLLHFLLYELRPERIQQVMAGSTSKHLNVADIRKLSVMLPPLHIQQGFTESTSCIQTLQRSFLHSAKCNDDLFYSLQQRAFCGEL